MPRSAQPVGALALALATALLAMGTPAQAQESKSSAVVKEFVQLVGGEMRYVAAKTPDGDNEFVAALHIPGVQLLVVRARYEHPPFITEMLGKRDYQGVYADLNSSSYVIAPSRMIFEDLREDGLMPRHGDDTAASDSIDIAGKRVILDGDWKRQKLSEKEYFDAFTSADQKYAESMALLTAALKKGS